MKKSTIAVLIPTFNRATLIVDAVNSCLTQSIPPDKIIIYDDGSTDNTPHVIHELQKSTEIITYIRGDTNNGIGYARNKLLENVDTDYACWLDSDDLMHEERIRESLGIILGLDVVYCNISHITKNNSTIVHTNKHIIDIKRYDKNNFHSLKNNTACATAFFTASVAKEKFVDELTLGAEDVLWLWKLLQKDYHIGHIPQKLYFYRSHEDRIGNNKKKQSNIAKKESENIIINKYIKEYMET